MSLWAGLGPPRNTGDVAEGTVKLGGRTASNGPADVCATSLRNLCAKGMIFPVSPLPPLTVGTNWAELKGLWKIRRRTKGSPLAFGFYSRHVSEVQRTVPAWAGERDTDEPSRYSSSGSWKEELPKERAREGSEDRQRGGGRGGRA